MSKMRTIRCWLLLGALILAACSDPSGPSEPADPPATPVDTTSPPALLREFRGLWIATVANIDWPSRNTLSAEQQRTELLDILDRAQAIGINAIVLQVRPAADAVYASTLEPWAALLTGAQGTSPGYDPLAFAIEQAHARGLELHAWVNPFRAGNASDTTRLHATHMFRAQRNLVRVYGTQIWLDPGEPAVHDHSMRVITDIVRRYDIDAIHADDYFYPYVQNDASGRAIPFPDSATHARYGAGIVLADWRRANVDRFIERLYNEVHAIKPTIKVGISPFGIWRPNNPPGVQGLDAYASIYADSRKWLQQGWVDYLAPQLYWAINAPQQSFPALFDWWITQNTRGRYVWPGLAVYRTNNGYSVNEVPDQIRLIRSRTAGTGNILYNTTWTLKQNAGVTANLLGSDLYRTRALVPAFTWLDANPPGAPTLTVSGSAVQIAAAAGEPARWWAVRYRSATQGWSTRVLFGTTTAFSLDSGVDRVLVEAVDQAGNASTSAEWRR